MYKAFPKAKLTPARKGGFTIIEIVLVVFLVAAIAAFAYPHLDSAIDHGRFIECEGQLEALRRAKSLYVVDHLGQGSPVTPAAQAVFDSYFVHPFPKVCPRLGTNPAVAVNYDNPYNVYVVSKCEFCRTNVPAGARPGVGQP